MPNLVIGSVAEHLTSFKSHRARIEPSNCQLFFLGERQELLQQRKFPPPPRQYVGRAKALGGDGVRVTTRHQFHEAMKVADRSTSFYLIEAVVSSKDVSRTWRPIAQEVISLAKP